MDSPILPLAPELLYDFDMDDEPGVFQMDGTDDVQGYGHLDTVEPLEVDVDQAQVREKSASDYRILTL
jgi:hypothetical protein